MNDFSLIKSLQLKYHQNSSFLLTLWKVPDWLSKMAMRMIWVRAIFVVMCCSEHGQRVYLPAYMTPNAGKLFMLRNECETFWMSWSSHFSIYYIFTVFNDAKNLKINCKIVNKLKMFSGFKHGNTSFRQIISTSNNLLIGSTYHPTYST